MKKAVVLLLIFAVGAFLRMILLQDIEYKYDERFMYDQTQNIGVTQSWPAVGMESGVQVRNPAMSIWIFVVLKHVFGAQTPPDLARAVQVMNVLAIGLILLLAIRVVPESEQVMWLWTGALVAVNPLAVLLHRKIWAQSTLPLLCVLMWLAWFYREKKLGAFFWGFLGACIGQIHLSGFFLAFAVFLWTALFEKKREAPKKVRWGAWLTGSFVGALGLIPWMSYLLSSQSHRSQPIPWIEILHFRYWTHWVTDAFGLGLSYSLGPVQFSDFLRYPLIAGHPSWLVGLCHLVLVATLILLLIPAIFRLRPSIKSDFLFGQSAVFWGCGILLTLSGAFIHRHYMIVTFPFEWLWLSRLALSFPRRGQAVLSVIMACNLILSVCFLYYIHVNHGAVTGDYGLAYEFQN